MYYNTVPEDSVCRIRGRRRENKIQGRPNYVALWHCTSCT